MLVRGKYNSNDNDSIIRLFDGMTVDEKNDVLSLNFAQIWYRIWFSNTTVGRQETTGYAPAGFVVAKSKFENTFLIDRGEKLRKLLGCSKINAARIWEIPKGKKKNRNEADIHCAVREFYEETGVEKKSYKLFPNVRKQSYIDDGVQYTNIYYIAMACHNIAPRIDFNKQSQLEEVADIRWANSDALKTLDESGRLHKFVKPIFNFIKKHAR
jgi:8-oxo-dGTP pyrophosphatase MutT (NUDIX family)